jgi:RND family efflux transporter MFP subunit
MKMRNLYVLFLLLLSCTSPQQDAIKDGQKAPLQTIIVQEKSFVDYLHLDGRIQAKSRINILAEEGGVLSEIIKEKGTFAETGDTLAILDNQVLKSSFEQAAATLKLAELDFKSKENLYKKKAIPENEFLLAQYRLDQARAQYNITRARYHKLFISAPFDGYVNDRFYDMGAFVAQMTPLFDYMDNHIVIIAFEINENYIDDIKKGTPARVTFDAINQLVLETKVSLVYKAIDPQTRTFRAEIWIENPGHKLAPDMSANIRLLRGKFDNQIIVPKDAILFSEHKNFVFLDSAGIMRKVPVEIVATFNDSLAVQGLNAGDTLVVSDQNEISIGDSMNNDLLN